MLFIATSSFVALADTPECKLYDWERTRHLDTLTAAEKKEGGLIMLDKRIVETSLLPLPGGKSQAVIYSTRHMIIRVSTDYAIESYNTVYIPMTNVIEL